MIFSIKPFLTFFGAAIVITFSFNMHVKAQSLSGMTGLFQIPTAEMMPDKSVRLSHHVIPQKYSVYRRSAFVRLGYVDDEQIGYTANSFTLTIHPRLEVMFRFSYELDVPRGPDIEIFMDRMIAGKLLILKEKNNQPALLIGIHDPGSSSKLLNVSNGFFSANYFVASKNFVVSNIKLGTHLGYAFELFSQRTIEYDGLFGGISVAHHKFDWSQFVIEYDSFNVNTAIKVILFDRIQIMGGLYNFDQAAYGVSYRFQF